MNQPSPTPGGASSDRTGRFVTQPNGHIAPLSPHMGVWRWHVTMTASILFRATIIAATVGVLFVLAWLGALAFGPEAFQSALDLAGSPLGLFVGFGLTAEEGRQVACLAANTGGKYIQASDADTLKDALVQTVVQFRCFLHIGLRRSARADLLLVLFSVLIIALMVSGTLVVIFNLRERMM